MQPRQLFSRILAFLSAGFLLAACSPSQPAVAPALDLATASSPPTLTPAPTLPPTPVSTAIETLETEEGWDLVIFGDSSLMGVGDYYAAYIEEDLNIPVRLHDMWQGSMSAVALLDKLQTNEKWRNVVREAEVVVYFGNPVDSATGDWECIAPRYYVTDCSPNTFTNYQTTLEAIVEEILALRAGSPTIIRATDLYVPILSLWRKADVEEACTICLENMNEAVHQAAAAQHVPVAYVYDAFNSSTHDENPRDKNYIGPDGIHTSDLGKIKIASLLRDLGYEPLAP